MINCYMSGRMGNQFFRYAYARAIMYARGDRDKLFLNFDMVNAREKKEGFENVLQYFEIQSYDERTTLEIFLSLNMRQKYEWIVFLFRAKILDRLFRGKRRERLYENLRNNGIMYASEREFSKMFPIPSEKTVVINGNFENPQYFKDIRNILLEEFSPRFPEKEENAELYQVIRKTNSVCVTIRRGDYLSNKYRKSFFLCDEEYFKKAIEEIKKRVERPVFCFFSDDIEWVKENIKIEGGECYYESGKDPIWEKIRLMYNCKHFIISNSTFSWWAQYLSRNEDKVVVSPNRWFNAELETFLIQDNFVKIKV